MFRSSTSSKKTSIANYAPKNKILKYSEADELQTHNLCNNNRVRCNLTKQPVNIMYLWMDRSAYQNLKSC